MTKKPCSFENCPQQADPKLLEMKIVGLPPNPQEFYDNERKGNYNYYKGEAQAEGQQDCTFSYYCPKHGAKLKGDCDRACSEQEHFDPQGICQRQRRQEGEATQGKYTNNKPVKEMTTRQLKTAIQKDIEELKEILPLEEGLLPNEDDTQTGDSDVCGDLLKEMKKITTIITSENGLNDKLEEWSYRTKEEQTNDF